jgi:very-short-patch-repair endonuclease
MKTEESRNKFKSTCIVKYGADNPMKNIKVQSKLKSTFRKKPKSFWDDRYDKTKKTNLERIGVENPFQCLKIQEQIKKTNIKKYGVPYSSQNPSTRDKYRETSLLRFGVDNWAKTYEARQMYRENFLRDLSIQKNNGLPIKGRIGHMELSCLNELQNHTKFDIIRNPQVIGYIPDGYIKELNLLIEFDEHWHTHTWAKKHDKKKDDDYFHADFEVIRIKLDEWIESKTDIIDKFKKFIEELENKNYEGTD